MMKIVLIVLTGLAAVPAGAMLYGACRWNSNTHELRARLDEARVPVHPKAVDFNELEGLPTPVQRYLRKVLKEGEPMVAGVRIQHKGTFNIDETAEQWKPFTSDQKIVMQRPGFDWDGRIAMMPGVQVRVHDAYVAGEGILHASLLGLLSLEDLRDSGDMAAGELMRFLAETVWYPTALLPGQGVSWQAADDRSAYATLSDGAISLTMLFTFDEQGLVETVKADSRGRIVAGKVVPVPWQGRVWNYQERRGMRVPLDAEVAWLLPEGPRPYWRGRITRIVYEPAQ